MDACFNRVSTDAGPRGFRRSMACHLFAYHPFFILQNLNQKHLKATTFGYYPVPPRLSTLTAVLGLFMPTRRTRPAQDQQDDSAPRSKTEILRDPAMLQALSERVYELLLEDLRIQKERNRNYGGWY